MRAILRFGAMAIGQTAHFAGAQTTVGSGFYQPFGVAVDSSGNLYVADADTFTI
jgi:DNA-binding beta-propeller fold protein YncE